MKPSHMWICKVVQRFCQVGLYAGNLQGCPEILSSRIVCSDNSNTLIGDRELTLRVWTKRFRPNSSNSYILSVENQCQYCEIKNHSSLNFISQWWLHLFFWVCALEFGATDCFVLQYNFPAKVFSVEDMLVSISGFLIAVCGIPTNGFSHNLSAPFNSSDTFSAASFSDEGGLDSPRKLSSLPRTTEIIIESTLDQDLADNDVWEKISLKRWPS